MVYFAWHILRCIGWPVQKDIGTETFGRNNFPVVKISAIKIRIIPDIRGLPDSTTSVPIYFLKSSVLRTVGKLSPGATYQTCLCDIQHPRKIDQAYPRLPQHRTAHNGVPGTGSVGPVADIKAALVGEHVGAT